jgi:hypothetical protein
MGSKASTEYYREYRRKKRLDPIYKEKELQRQRDYRKANLEKVREATKKSERKRRLVRYGLTEDAYTTMFLGQGCKCAICGTDTPGNSRDWHVDHDHISGKVRGILCHHCNLMLGNAKDNMDTLYKGILYLERNKDE